MDRLVAAALARLPLVLSDTPWAVGPGRRVGEDNDHMSREVHGTSAEKIRYLAERRVV